MKANAKRASPAVDFNCVSVSPVRVDLLGAPTAVSIALVLRYVGVYKTKTKIAPTINTVKTEGERHIFSQE